MGGQLFAGLLGGYSDTLLKKKEQEQKREDDAKKAELEVLKTAASTGQLSKEQMAATFSRMEEIVSSYGSGGKSGGKGKKSPFSLGNLIGRFDSGGQSGSDSGKQQTTPTTGGAGQKQTAVTGTQTAPSGGPPTRQQLFGPGSFQDPGEQQIQQAVKMQHAQITAMSQDMYGKDLKDLTPDERAELVHAYYKTPRAKMHPIIITGPNGEPVPGAQDTDNGTVIDSKGQVVDNPILWKAPPSMQAVAVVGEGGRITAAMRNPKDGKVYDASDPTKEIPNPKVLPPSGYQPTTSTTTGTHLDPITGKMYSTTSTTTRSKGGVSLGEPPARTKGGETTATRQESTADQERERAHREQHPPAAAKASIAKYKASYTKSDADLQKAKQALAALQKQQTSRGPLDDITHPNIEMKQAKAAVVKAQQQADNSKRAYDYVTLMQESIALGRVTPEAVEKIASQIEQTGSYQIDDTTTASGPPGRPATQ